MQALKMVLNSLMITLFMGLLTVQAEDVTPELLSDELYTQYEVLKEAVIDLNIELYNIEDEILGATRDEVVLFVANNVAATVIPEMISVSVDDQLSVEHFYSDIQLLALKEGGLHPLRRLDLDVGYHSLNIKLQYRTKSTSPLVIERQYSFDKKNRSKYIEILIAEDDLGDNPLLKVDSWE